jgi:hypothetical protein
LQHKSTKSLFSLSWLARNFFAAGIVFLLSIFSRQKVEVHCLVQRIFIFVIIIDKPFFLFPLLQFQPALAFLMKIADHKDDACHKP